MDNDNYISKEEFEKVIEENERLRKEKEENNIIFENTCNTFTETVNVMSKTIEKIDKGKTVQILGLLLFSIIFIICVTIIIILPIQ